MYHQQNFQECLTYNDILMVLYLLGSLIYRHNISLRIKNIPLNIPIVSSPMDTVTEYQMAKNMAIQGGLGILHRFMTIEEQQNMISKVKRSQSYFIQNPVTININKTYQEILDLQSIYNFSTFLCIDDQEIVQGIITKRDMKCMQMNSLNQNTIKAYMTPFKKLIYSKDPNMNIQEIKKILIENKIEQIPILNDHNKLIGLITLKDIDEHLEKKKSNIDNKGRLRVGAAVGIKEEDIERAKKLVQEGADVLVIDVANGHNQNCIDFLKLLKDDFEVDIVAGSVASHQGALKLLENGADGIRCGIGNGSICTTRLVSGCGVPQFSAVQDCMSICKEYGVPLISDGGNKNSGNMCKALAAGASCVMLGRLLAGCDESPSPVIYKDGKYQKIYRGMAGLGANISKFERNNQQLDINSFNSEGVEGYIPYTGPLNNILQNFVKGIQSGMSYNGARNLQELQKNVKFVKISQNSWVESNVHGINQIK